jgi:diguanylate cyclase (GGDEF)-like protein/PAS domain S-box-containing protein
MRHTTTDLHVTVILPAVISGIVLGFVSPLCRTLFGHGTIAFVLYSLSVAGAAILVSIGIRLAIPKRSMNRENQLDRDLLDAFLEHIPDNVFFKDCDSRFVRISRAMATYCGLKDPTQAVNKTDADIFSSEHAVQALTDEKEIIRTGQPMLEKEEKETWPDGHETWVLTTKVPLKDRSGRIVGTMGIAHNITDRKQAEARVLYMAMHDSLTGLPNRTLFQNLLSQTNALAARNHKQVSLLTLDLDRFKNVNDSFGRYVGDRLLVAVSKRLKANLRESDTIARLGSDEFAIALQMMGDDEETERVAQKVLNILSEPFLLEGIELRISASVGICRFPQNGENPEALLEFADAAMYEAKRKGRDRYCFFSPNLTEATRRQHKLESDLLQALERDEFVLHYQPFISTESGRITGVEALLRWQHPKQGLISPNQFIPQLEELGLMMGVGEWVLRTACHQNMNWQKIGLPPIRVAVNVSSQQFYQGNIVDTVAGILHESKLEPRFLELELTESRTLDDSEATINTMRHLKRLGVTLSLDDFGTGWSSLSYLRNFPLDRIKIDRSFIRDIPSQPAAEAVVKSILSLGRNLKIPCIAEGVETRQQLDYLKKQRCFEMQGFLFSQPLAARDCTALLRSTKYGVGNAAGNIGSDFATADAVARLVSNRMSRETIASSTGD